MFSRGDASFYILVVQLYLFTDKYTDLGKCYCLFLSMVRASRKAGKGRRGSLANIVYQFSGAE